MTDFKMPLKLGECRKCSCCRLNPFDGFPEYVMLPMACESAALEHFQCSLAELKDWGGLKPNEAVALMELRVPRPMNMIELVDAFHKYYWF